MGLVIDAGPPLPPMDGASTYDYDVVGVPLDAPGVESGPAKQ